MKRITIDIHKTGVLRGLVEIDSKEYGFSYTFGELGGGMQCNFDGGTDEYQELFHYLRKIEDLIRMVDRYDEAIRKT